jgi:hypothetical protein
MTSPQMNKVRAAMLTQILSKMRIISNNMYLHMYFSIIEQI